MPAKKLTRLQFDVTQQILDAFKHLQTTESIPSRSQIFRSAIKLLAFVVKKQQEGWTIHLTRGDERIEVILFL